MKSKEMNEQLMEPFKAPEGYTFEALRQLSNEDDLPELKEKHQLIEQYDTNQLLQVMAVLNMPVSDEWSKEKLLATYYDKYYSPRYLKWLISFVDPRINQLFINDAFISKESVPPQVWSDILPVLDILTQTGIIESQKVSEFDAIFKARPAYSEMLFTLAEKDIFRHTNEFNVLLVSLMNQLITVYGIMKADEVKSYLIQFNLTIEEKAEYILELIRTMPLVFTVFGYMDDLFVSKRFNSPEKREALLEQQSKFERYHIDTIQEALQIANNVFLRVPSSRLLRRLKDITKEASANLPKGFEEHLIQQVLNFPIPSVEPLFNLVEQFVSVTDEQKQLLEEDLKILVRHKHLPEFNGQSVHELMKKQKAEG
ncbi:hypothetical protein [Atopobacter phocae]|uniref:hypothetical protein n=1 Tax=Atopobacter phocae TaxID=136492 RepID=UPI00046FAFA9|nr:hypothetical protein [Atopobacter phocae]